MIRNLKGNVKVEYRMNKRFRHKEIIFTLAEEENIRLNQRVMISGMGKEEYMRGMVLNGKLDVLLDENHGNKLADAIERLSEELYKLFLFGEEHEMAKSILECRVMIDELNTVLTSERGKSEILSV